MNIVDEVVNKIDITEERGDGVNFIVDVYRTSRSCLFSEALHSVRLATMPRGRWEWGWGARSKRNASQKFTFRSSGANQSYV